MEKRKLVYKLAMMKAGISQRKLSHILKYSECYVSYLLAGKRTSRKFDLWVKKNLNLAEFEGVFQ